MESVINKNSENFLWEYVRHLNLINCRMKITPAIAGGENHLGIVAKIEVKSENRNYNWIVKCAIEDDITRTTLALAQAFEREVYVYNNVLLEFERFQKEKGLLSPFKSFTKLYTHSLTAPHECVVMEDMKALGYQLRDRKKPLDYNHVLMVIKEYGRFHALSFALRDQKPSLFEEIAKNTEEIYFNNNEYASEATIASIKTFGDKALNALNSETRNSVYEKLLQFKENMFTIARELVKSKLSGKYSALTHGDCWINNFLFKYSNANTPDVPSEMCFIDWQLSRLGSPVLDLSYFLFTCTDGEFRNKYYDKMISEYYNSLCSFLREMGSDPEKLFPFSVLQEHLKVFSGFGLYMSIQVLYSMLKDKNENNSNNINMESYNKRVREIVLDFDKRGYDFNPV